MKRLLLPALAALALAGCATAPTVYQPAPGPNAVGFSEYRIEPGRWRVSFLGGSGAPAGYVSDLALRRAADLAIQEGYDWFRVSDRFMEALPDRGPRFSVGVGVGTTFPVGAQGGVVKATLEVMMGKGPKPAGADVYDAREIQRAAGVRL